MKDFFQYRDEIHKCSQCGLCMKVCPLYQKTKNDCANARGLISMLDGVLKGRLEYSKDIEHYLDMCIDMNCDKCKSFCPSRINLPEIFKSAKNISK